MPDGQKQHIFVLHVENDPCVLDRVASLFRRRGYNIESLTLGQTERPGVLRMTILAGIREGAGRRVEASLYKLLNVLSVEDLTFSTTISRSLALIKVEAQVDSQQRLIELVRVFRAQVVDFAPQSVIVEITGSESKIQALMDVLHPFRILEVTRTGQAVMSRGVQRAANRDSCSFRELRFEPEASQSV